ncbi:MAG: tRNA (adenosine(37)-N6)-threonylcarbamoyltransferase complex dimerization subunit type 1 TsaB [Woeseiaceae bacterium]
MKLLALDTSSIACSVALQVDDVVKERYEEQPREHTRLLVPMIRSLLQESQVGIDDLDAIVLGNGPGSFIGMRIAASVAQGLAHGSGLNIVPVSSLAAVAAEVFVDATAEFVAVAQDAHMSEVYLGVFRRGSDGLPVPLFGERLHGQNRIEEFAELEGGMCIAAGIGWQRYPALLQSNSEFLHESAAISYPRARHLLAQAVVLLQNDGACFPADLAPAYLRQKVAEKPA